jgi:hypothetical protein
MFRAANAPTAGFIGVKNRHISHHYEKEQNDRASLTLLWRFSLSSRFSAAGAIFGFICKGSYSAIEQNLKYAGIIHAINCFQSIPRQIPYMFMGTLGG